MSKKSSKRTQQFKQKIKENSKSKLIKNIEEKIIDIKGNYVSYSELNEEEKVIYRKEIRKAKLEYRKNNPIFDVVVPVKDKEIKVEVNRNNILGITSYEIKEAVKDIFYTNSAVKDKVIDLSKVSDNMSRFIITDMKIGRAHV